MVRGNNYYDLLKVATALGKATDILGKVGRILALVDGDRFFIPESLKRQIREVKADLFCSTSTIDNLISQIEREDDK